MRAKALAAVIALAVCVGGVGSAQAATYPGEKALKKMWGKPLVLHEGTLSRDGKVARVCNLYKPGIEVCWYVRLRPSAPQPAPRAHVS